MNIQIIPTKRFLATASTSQPNTASINPNQGKPPVQTAPNNTLPGTPPDPATTQASTPSSQSEQSNGVDNNENKRGFIGWVLGGLAILGGLALLLLRRGGGETAETKASGNSSNGSGPASGVQKSANNLTKFTDEEIRDTVADYFSYSPEQRANTIAKGASSVIEKKYAEVLLEIFNEQGGKKKFEDLAKALTSRYTDIINELKKKNVAASAYSKSTIEGDDTIFTFVARDIAKQLYYHQNQHESNAQKYPTIKEDIFTNQAAQDHIIDTHLGWELADFFGSLPGTLRLDRYYQRVKDQAVYSRLVDLSEKAAKAAFDSNNAGTTMKGFITASELSELGRLFRTNFIEETIKPYTPPAEPPRVNPTNNNHLIKELIAQSNQPVQIPKELPLRPSQDIEVIYCWFNHGRTSPGAGMAADGTIEDKDPLVYATGKGVVHKTNKPLSDIHELDIEGFSDNGITEGVVGYRIFRTNKQNYFFVRLDQKVLDDKKPDPRHGRRSVILLVKGQEKAKKVAENLASAIAFEGQNDPFVGRKDFFNDQIKNVLQDYGWTPPR
ncbi:MAG: hypothetical protein SFU25_11300 [Candidatus Caenarcaniphilales bacterium]|nr:hypothetical protein [Candidatus Caenarcaniphilales bacterium]